MENNTGTFFSRPITDIIKARTSVRSYRPDSLTQDIKDRIIEYVSSIRGPFNIPVKFKLITDTSETGSSNINAGTGGVIRGASAYLAAVVPKTGRNLEELGYTFEKAILYITSLGLGTCWLGGTFDRNKFEKAVSLSKDEVLPCVTPVGYPGDSRSIVDSFIRFSARSAKRKGWDELFHSDSFGNALTPAGAGKYATPLEMVRLAPSASNNQPWRVVVTDKRCLFYLKRTKGYPKLIKFDIQRIDAGIAMCHFELTAVEAGLKGRWDMTEPAHQDMPEGTEYIATWVSD